jgi:hypothetical protein
MAQQFIDFGSFPDDPDADAIRTAFQKTQNNFNQLFTQASSGSVQTISSPTGGGIDVSSPAGNVVLIANIACVQVHTSTLSVGIGANGLTDATLTSSSQVLWVDLPINISNVQSINLQPTTTLLSNAPAVRIQQTWNSASNTFIAFYTNITDTNSSSASKLIDLQVNAASKFSVNKDGDISANSISITAFTTGNISVGNGSFSGNLLVSGNITGGNLITSGNVSATGNVSGANLVTTGNASITGNVSAGNISATLLTGTITTNAQPNITSVGTLTSLAVTGNVTAGNVYANSGTIGALLLTGTLTTNAQPNITSVGTLTSLSVTGNITGANLQGSLANGNSNISIPNANGNINLSAVGNANVVVVTGTGANVTGTLNVTGNTTAGNVILSGATSGVSLSGSFGTRGQTLKSDGNSNAIWSTQFYYGNTPPTFSDLNYGDIFFYIDAPNNFQRLYMWVTDGSSDYFYDFLPPSF